jgi:hypothetical protein
MNMQGSQRKFQGSDLHKLKWVDVNLEGDDGCDRDVFEDGDKSSPPYA